MQSSNPSPASSTARISRGRWLELAFILCLAVGIVVLCTHLSVQWLKIKVTWGGRQPYGASDQQALAILHGSSVAYSGIDWNKVAEALGNRIDSWASPGSTPSEWEHMHLRSPDVRRTFIAVSPVDLNEYGLCDFRAEIVPLGQTIQDLWQMQADWPFWKMVLSQYPMTAVRKLFPTVGRSDGVMTGIRDQLARITQKGSHGKAAEGFRFGPEADSEREEKVSDWSPARLQRRMVLTRAGCQGKHSFNGLKKAAMKRLLEKAYRQGEVTWIVLGVSPIYQNEFLTQGVRQDFEMALEDLQKSFPQARLIRLDSLPALQDNDMFADFVHANRYGQQIATDAFLRQLGNNSSPL